MIPVEVGSLEDKSREIPHFLFLLILLSITRAMSPRDIPISLFEIVLFFIVSPEE